MTKKGEGYVLPGNLAKASIKFTITDANDSQLYSTASAVDIVVRCVNQNG